jgi:hypothetical protein
MRLPFRSLRYANIPVVDKADQLVEMSVGLGNEAIPNATGAEAPDFSAG